MKRVWLFAAVFAVFCSDSPRRSAGVSPAGTPASSRRGPVLNIQLQSPRAGDVIRQNPVEVRGQARTFENNVVIHILDANRELLVETFTTAIGEMGTFSLFAKEVFLTRMPGPQIIVEAFDYSAKDGSVIDLNSVTLPFEVEPRKITLYFPSARRSPTDCSQVFPEERQVPNSISVARLLVEALMSGPTVEGLDNPFPRGSAVRSVNLRDGILTVDFSERLGNVGGSCRALAIRAALEKTLLQLPTVKRVRITFLGSEEAALQP